MIDFKIDKVSETISTNELLKTLADKESLPEGYTVMAVAQTGGRGQMGAFWESQPGQNITMSLLLRPEFLKADRMFLISKAVSLGIADYLSAKGDGFKIKWPNDIYYNDKKICGVLIENQLMGGNIVYSIVGIGLNVNQETFISDAPNPVSLFNIFGRKFDVQAELHELLNQIDVWYQMLADGWEEQIDEAYFARLYRTDGVYTFRTADGAVINGKITNVEANGRLHIATENDGEKLFWFKEITFANEPQAKNQQPIDIQ